MARVNLKTAVVVPHGMGRSDGAAFGGIYFLGFIGAAVYYVQASHGFWGGVGGFLKALVWPAFLVYELLRHATS